MEEFKKLLDNLLIVTVEEIMLQTGMKKYEVIRMMKILEYDIEALS